MPLLRFNRKTRMKFVREMMFTIGGSFIFVGLIQYSLFGIGLYITIGYWVVGSLTIAIGVSQ